MNEPHSIDAERAVLGAMLVACNAIPGVRAEVSGEDFYLPPHQLVFSALSDTYHAEGELDIVLAGECLRGRGELDRIGGVDFLAGLAQETATAFGVERHAKIVRAHAIARQGMVEAARLQAVLSSGGSTEDIQASATKLREIADTQGNGHEEAEAPDVLDAGEKDYLERATLSASGRDYAGLDTGFDGINDRINGFRPGELTIFGADSNVGKTTLAAQAFHRAVKDGACGIYFAQEEKASQVADRMVLMEADGVSPVRFQKGLLTEEEHHRLKQARIKLAPLNFRIYDRCRSIDRIEHALRSGQRKVDLCVIDHLHRTSGHGESRHRELGAIVKRCKDLSLDLDTHVLLLSQLARAKDRHDRRPRIDDLRESGSIEEEADNVVLIYRPGRYDHLREEAANKGAGALDDLMQEAYALVEKARRRGPGNVKLVWRSDVALFGSPFSRSM